MLRVGISQPPCGRRAVSVLHQLRLHFSISLQDIAFDRPRSPNVETGWRIDSMLGIENPLIADGRHSIEELLTSSDGLDIEGSAVKRFHV